MKMQFLYLSLLFLTTSFSNLYCSNKKTTASKTTIDLISNSKSKRDLVRENLELRQRLAQESPKINLEFKSPSPDLEKGLELTKTSSLRSAKSLRSRADSAISEDRLTGSVDDLHGTVAEFLALQNTQLQRQKAADDERDKFQKQVYRDLKYAKRTAFAGTLAAIAYTTAGFVWQNWTTIGSFLGGGPGDSSSNSTST